MRFAIRTLAGLATALFMAGAALAGDSQAAASVEEGPLRNLGIDHVGMNVPDIDVAIDFFTGLLGARVVSDVRPDQPSADWKQRLSWRASSRIERIVMLQTPTGDRFELFQYRGPETVQQQPHADDLGATHIAFKVTDMSSAVTAVKQRGLRMLSEPVTNADGTRWVYFLSPWDSPLELIQPSATQP